ncbi:hypothetical protein B0T22DRAFT_149457 [Podospora appendiculata]|uniref:Uncharacterized protein n=1 Tax=Podospora appendiculata TaxID=314037 RepID=A0AAE0X8Z6_9PEZI|nr:hypothetical protein B0T22DRAFT_149457 [Podospora appendiculata]
MASYRNLSPRLGVSNDDDNQNGSRNSVQRPPPISSTSTPPGAHRRSGMAIRTRRRHRTLLAATAPYLTSRRRSIAPRPRPRLDLATTSASGSGSASSSRSVSAPTPTPTEATFCNDLLSMNLNIPVTELPDRPFDRDLCTVLYGKTYTSANIPLDMQSEDYIGLGSIRSVISPGTILNPSVKHCQDLRLDATGNPAGRCLRPAPFVEVELTNMTEIMHCEDLTHPLDDPFTLCGYCVASSLHRLLGGKKGEFVCSLKDEQVKQSRLYLCAKCIKERAIQRSQPEGQALARVGELAFAELLRPFAEVTGAAAESQTAVEVPAAVPDVDDQVQPGFSFSGEDLALFDFDVDFNSQFPPAETVAESTTSASINHHPSDGGNISAEEALFFDFDLTSAPSPPEANARGSGADISRTESWTLPPLTFEPFEFTELLSNPLAPAHGSTNTYATANVNNDPNRDLGLSDFTHYHDLEGLFSAIHRNVVGTNIEPGSIDFASQRRSNNGNIGTAAPAPVVNAESHELHDNGIPARALSFLNLEDQINPDDWAFLLQLPDIPSTAGIITPPELAALPDDDDDDDDDDEDSNKNNNPPPAQPLPTKCKIPESLFGCNCVKLLTANLCFGHRVIRCFEFVRKYTLTRRWVTKQYGDRACPACGTGKGVDAYGFKGDMGGEGLQKLEWVCLCCLDWVHELWSEKIPGPRL